MLCNENPICVIPEKKLRGLSPHFHILVSVSELYISVHIFSCKQNRQTDPGNILIAHRHMNVEIGTEATQFLFWEYLFRIFGIVSLQCALAHGPTVCGLTALSLTASQLSLFSVHAASHWFETSPFITVTCDKSLS